MSVIAARMGVAAEPSTRPTMRKTRHKRAPTVSRALLGRKHLIIPLERGLAKSVDMSTCLDGTQFLGYRSMNERRVLIFTWWDPVVRQTKRKGKRGSDGERAGGRGLWRKSMPSG